MSVLIVDDNIVTRSIMKKHVYDTTQCCVILCELPEIAMEIFIQNEIRWIFTDINLPSRNAIFKDGGITLIKMIRIYEKDSMAIPVEIIAFSSDERMKKAALDAGADRFIS